MDTTQLFSPYGQDLRMLSFLWSATALAPAPAPATRHFLRSPSVQRSSAPRLLLPARQRSSALSPLNMPTSHPPPVPTVCHLLALPPELLDQILTLVLPYTKQTSKGIAWVRTSAALLATCSSLHAAGSRLMYGSNTFVLRTSFAGTKWHLAWIRPPCGFKDTISVCGSPDSHVLVPSRDLAFPAAIPARYRTLMHYVSVAVEVEDAYTGEIKYGFGGPGLADGVRVQVSALVDELGRMPELRRLVVRLAGVGIGRTAEESRILAPLAKLRNVSSLVVKRG